MAFRRSTLTTTSLVILSVIVCVVISQCNATTTTLSSRHHRSWFDSAKSYVKNLFTSKENTETGSESESESESEAENGNESDSRRARLKNHVRGAVRMLSGDARSTDRHTNVPDYDKYETFIKSIGDKSHKKGEEIVFDYSMSEREKHLNTKYNRVCCPRHTLYSVTKFHLNGNKNQDICEVATNLAKDSNDKYMQVGMAGCVGAVGDQCAGLPFEGLTNILSADQFPTCRRKDKDTFMCLTVVGSIRHDLCCTKYPDGKFCNNANYPALRWASIDNRCACAAEIKKAITDLIHGYGWYEEYKSDLYTFDELQSVDEAQTRKTILPLDSKKFESSVNLRDIWENRVTVTLKAPEGSPLSCPDTDSRCKFECPGGKDSCSVHKPDGYVAGDSVFCASGKFKMMKKEENRYWGLCSSDGSGKQFEDNKRIFMKGFCEKQKATMKKECPSHWTDAINPFSVVDNVQCAIATHRYEKNCKF
jgi:hypothetical protein